jgi:hypothetical protein
MHILHLLDPARCGDEGILACRASAAAASPDDPSPPQRHEFWIIGSAADERRARTLGICTSDRIHPRARAGAGRALRTLIRTRAVFPDIVQAWSLDALELARECFGDRDGPARVAVISHTPPAGPSSPPADERTSRAAHEVICTFDRATCAWLAPAGTASWGPSINLLEAPAFPPGGPLAIERAALRNRLGLDGSDIAVAVLADPPGALDAAGAMFTAGVLHALGHRTVFLIRRGARHERRAAAYQRAHARRWGMLLCDLLLPELLAAADVALIERAAPHGDSPTCGPVALSLALSMGVPIASAPRIFTSSPTSWGSPWPVRVGSSAAVGRSAVPLADLLGTAALRVEIASQARAWCERARARNGFQSSLSRIWSEMGSGLGLPVPASVE